MRVVLDTNVLARVAISPDGLAAEVLERIRADAHVLVICREMLSELSRILTYPRTRKLHGLDDSAIQEFVERVATGSLIVPLEGPVPPVVPFDADDDWVVATAVEGEADVLCTRNMKHFGHPDVVAYCRERAVEILDDVALLARLRSTAADDAT